MRILLGRHCESEGNVDPRAYIEKGDAAIELTPRGWEQAAAAGKFLREFYAASDTKKWPVPYLSSYMRPKQTFRAIYEEVKGLFDHDPKLHEDPRLCEKFFGAAAHLYHPDETLSLEDRKFRDSLLALSKKVYGNDPFTARNLFGESSKDTLESVKGFLDGTFARDCREGKDDFLIISHGAVIQSFMMSWAHLPMSAWRDIKNPGNGDIISIEGQPKNWKIRKIYDGEAMQAVDLDPLNGVKPFSLADLPPLPRMP